MYTLDYLRSLGRRPRVHPNGFIQFDLVPNRLRLNVWTPQALRPKPMHPIHNHSFDVSSQIIVGMLTNLTYDFNPAHYEEPITTVLYRATRLPDSFDSELRKVTDRNPYGTLELSSATSHSPGDTYYMERKTLHDSIPHGLTATIMKSLDPDPNYGPIIAVPHGIDVDNTHRREEFEEGVLWEHIGRALEKATFFERVGV